MSIGTLVAWVIAAMALGWPLMGSKIPGRTPKDIAEAIATASLEKPLFVGGDAEKQTASLITAIGLFESGLQQIVGDCKDKPPGWAGCGKEPGARIGEPNGPQSFCFMQIHLPGGAKTAEGWTAAEIMADPLKCARAGREIIRLSIKASPADVPLLQYAGRKREAQNRFELAKKIFKATPDIPVKCDE